MSPDAPSSKGSIGTDQKIPAPPLFHVVFKAFVDRAVDGTKSELASSGQIGPTVFFVYPNGTMKAGALSFRDEFRRDLLKRRIREKALAENAAAVMVLTEGEGEGPGTVILSGAAPGMRASLRVDYAFDKNTKAITSWKTRWLHSPCRNTFLDGIFDTPS